MLPSIYKSLFRQKCKSGSQYMYVQKYEPEGIILVATCNLLLLPILHLIVTRHASLIFHNIHIQDFLTFLTDAKVPL